MYQVQSLIQRVQGLAGPTSLRALAAVLNAKAPISLRGLCENNSRFSRICVAPLSVLEQNMGLLVTPATYQGTERDKAIDALIANLRGHQPDVVGLCEMFSDGERDHIRKQLANLYPYSTEGPDEADIESDGGLLLLSRHPIVDRHQTIYRQCCGEDCLANKGVLHARIAVPGHPAKYDVFLSHMQSCPPEVPTPNVGLGRNCLEKLNHYQTVHLSDFVHAHSDPQRIAILMGDLNQNGFDSVEYGGLVSRLHNPDDLWLCSGDGSKPGITHDDCSSFGVGTSPRSIDDPARHQHGARWDYFFTWSQGRLFQPLFDDAHVVVWQSSPSRDISDHYGVWTHQTCVRELAVDQSQPIDNVQVRLSRFRCLTSTSGPTTLGDDEVEFELRVQTAAGFKATNRTNRYEGLGNGSERAFSDAGTLDCGSPGDWLDVTAEAWEVDIGLGVETGRAPLGPTSIRLDRRELCSRLGQTYERVLPILTGDGGEYAVAVAISVSG